MKIFWLGLLVVGMSAFGQRAGGFGRGFGGFTHAPSPATSGVVILGPRAGFGPPAFGGQFGLPQLGPIPPLGGQLLHLRRGPFFGNRFGFPGFGSFYSPVWPAYWGNEMYSGAPAAPNVVVIQPAPQAAFEPAPSPPPPKPAEPVIHEYNFGEVAAAPAPTAEQRAYVIALKNGARLFAVALWVQGQTLYYVDRDSNPWHVALEDVDRALTRKLNLEQQLPLSLPPAGPTPSPRSKS